LASSSRVPPEYRNSKRQRAFTSVACPFRNHKRRRPSRRGGRPSMDALTLTKANDLIRIAMEKAAADYGRPICVAVCDAAGFLVAFQRMEGAPLRSIAIAQGKAYSAARMQVSTDALLQRLERENIPAS